MITQNELNEFEQAFFTGVTVGVGSLVFLFSTGVTILVQCPFKCGKPGYLVDGHGESLMTSINLFSLLNQMVVSAGMIEGSTFKLVLSDESEIYIIPDNSGFESYVITTSQGPYPVIGC